MKTALLALFAGAFMVISCRENEPVNVYENCCGTEPVLYTVGLGKIYIANLVTANNDGINDVFFPQATASILSFSDLEIRDNDEKLLLAKASLSPNDPSQVWDGSVDGEPYRGRFFWRMTARDALGTTGTIEGTACVFRCDTNEIDLLVDPAACFFPSQYDGNGGYDPGLSTGEADCL